MPDPRIDFPDVATPAAESAEQPPIATLARRAVMRRRRRAIAALTALAVIVAGIAIGSASLLHDHSRAQQPIHQPTKKPAPSPSTDSRAERIIAHSGMESFAVDDANDLLILWSSCAAGGAGLQHCDFAWQLETRGHTFVGALPRNSSPEVATTSDGFAIVGTHQLAEEVGLDGSVEPMHRDDDLTAGPGISTIGRYRTTRLVNGKLGTWAPLRTSSGGQLTAAVTSGETVWAEEIRNSGATLAWQTDDGPWQTRTLASGNDTTWGPVAALGSHVVATSGGVADDYNPLNSWDVSTDFGHTWTSVDPKQFPFGDVDEMAVTPDGTLFVASLADGLFRSTDATWTHFAKVATTGPVNWLASTKDGVAGLQWHHGKPWRIVRIDSAGTITPWGESTSAAPTTRVDQIIADGTLANYAANGGGDVLSVWSKCPFGLSDGCAFAWLLSHGGQRVGEGVLPTDSYAAPAAAGTGAFILTWGTGQGIVVRPDGTVLDRRHGFSGPPVIPHVGDVVAPADGRRAALLVDPAGRAGALPSSKVSWAEGEVTDEGVVWAVGGTQNDMTAIGRLKGGSWTVRDLPGSKGTLPGYLAVSDDHVAALAGGDGATILPVIDFSVTSDGGAHWTDLSRDDVPFKDIASMAATTTGTLFVCTDAGDFYRSTDSTWTHFARVAGNGDVHQVESAGTHVVASVGAYPSPDLVSVDDTGRGTPLPALR